MTNPKASHRINGVFKRPHLSASKVTSKGNRQSAAACVSLSKSTMSKTRTASQRPHRLAPGVGGGGYLANLEFRVKSFFSKLSDKPANQPGGPRQRRQLLKKPPNPVKLFLEENFEALLAEILKSPEELLSISWRAASSEAELPGQPPFLLLFSWRPKPLQSAKDDRGAPLGSAVSQKRFD